MKGSKIRILHVSETSGIGGAETVLLNVVTNLDSNQYESSVILFKDGWLGDKLRQNSIPTFIVKSTRSWDLGFVWRLYRKIKELKPSILHAHLPDANVYCSLAGFLAGVPVVTTYHGKISSSPNLRLPTKIKLLIVSMLSTKVVAVSDYLKSELHRLAKFPEKKIATIHNGVTARQPNPGFDALVKRKELGILKDEFVVGNVANMRADKGYEYFIKAAALIHAQIPQTKFLVIGEEQSDIKTMMIKEMEKSNLINSVLFLGFREDIVDLLNILDVFMLSSTSEGLSIATIEAMAAGAPVVATRCGGPDEIIIDSENGFLVPIKDEQSLASKALYLLHNRDIAAKMAEKAKLHVKINFSITNMANCYQNLYQEIINR
jgi:glycosyltransferase involved in cell wall biosynthesis